MKGSLVVITGGNSGLGLELVKLFKKAHKVLVIARNKRTEFKDVFYEYGSVSDENFLKEVYAKIFQRFQCEVFNQ